jgi:hypothetical protein
MTFRKNVFPSRTELHIVTYSKTIIVIVTPVRMSGHIHFYPEDGDITLARKIYVCIHTSRHGSHPIRINVVLSAVRNPNLILLP